MKNEDAAVYAGVYWITIRVFYGCTDITPDAQGLQHSLARVASPSKRVLPSNVVYCNAQAVSAQYQ